MTGLLSIFDSLCQTKPSEIRVICQSLVSLESVGGDQTFEIQPVNKNSEPEGDLLQISIPKDSEPGEFQKLKDAFMQASKLPYPKESKWASNVVFGIGLGTTGLFKQLGKGVSGVVTEPYKGAKREGLYGGAKGVGKGLVGLVRRPLIGGFDLIS